MHPLSTTRFALLGLALFTSGSAEDPARESSPEIIAFVGVDVVTFEPEVQGPGESAHGGLLRDQTVLVEGDRITAIQPAASLDVPEAALVLKCDGLFLAPGLMDMHAHVQDEETLVLFVANGVTSLRNLFGAPATLELRERIETGELLGPRIFTSGPILDGNPPVWPDSDVVTTAEEASAAVRAQHDAGYDFLKVYDRLTREVYDEIVRVAAELGMEVHGHVPSRVGIDGVLEAGQRTIEHLAGYGPELNEPDAPAWALHPGFENTAHGWSAALPGAIDEYVRRTQASGTWNCPTLVVLERAFEPIAIRRDTTEEDPALSYVARSLRARWEGAYLGDAICEEILFGMPARYAFVKALSESGAGLLLGTDTPNPFVVPGFAIHEELEHFVRAGLSPRSAIAAGTIDAARFLGRTGDLGEVRVGARADLVLLRSNPFVAVRAYRDPEGVLLGGRWLPREELVRLLARAAELAGAR